MYYLYRLKFKSPVLFGSERPGIGKEKTSFVCHADTFFSAICNEWLYLMGKESFESFYHECNKSMIKFSDLFPYNEDHLYLPKPLLRSQFKHIDPTGSKKDFKKLQFIPLKEWESYVNYLNGKKDFNPKLVNQDFAKEINTTKVNISRYSDTENDLYPLRYYIFNQQAGLYFITCFKNTELKAEFDIVLKSLSYSGIGGKRSSGFGKFEILTNESSTFKENKALLVSMLENTSSAVSMCLSLTYPTEKDLQTIITKPDKASYKIILRNGFIYSNEYQGNPQKKIPIRMFNSGSCFTKPLEGKIVNVSTISHAVYSYGKAMMIGVNYE